MVKAHYKTSKIWEKMWKIGAKVQGILNNWSRKKML